jgi:hypothetical protein
MKKTMLLIGAFGLVLQGAMAQTVLYSDDFEGANQIVGSGPWTSPLPNAEAGLGLAVPQQLGCWFGGGSGTFTVQAPLDSSGFFTTQAAEMDLTTGGGWFGYSSSASSPGETHTSFAASSDNALSDITFSMDVYVGGDSLAGATQPLTIWADQFPGTIKTFDASISPDITLDPIGNGWSHITFTLNQLVPSGTSGAYDPWEGIEFGIDGGTGVSGGVGTGTVGYDNILVMSANAPIPEPATIALVTLGGLGALVGIRRRRA